MSQGNTLFSVARHAKETFERNIDTIVAAFLIRHPDVLPNEIELVMRPGDDRALHFTIERKGGIRFPEELPEGEFDPNADDQDDTGADYAKGVAHGWNKAIQAFKDLNPPFQGEMRSTPQGFGDVEDAAVKAETPLVVAE
jgi:hypothetical protein